MNKCIRNVPGDLAAICLKAIQKEPERRYQTAEAFAEDLRRRLRRESPIARRPIWRQALLWSQCHRGWSLAIATACVAVVLVVMMLLQAASEREARAESEKLQFKIFVQAASEREACAEAEKLQFDRLSNHIDGWSVEVSRRVEAISAKHGLGKGDRLRDQFVAAMADLDAQVDARQKTMSSSVAFSPKGDRLLYGGVRAFRKEPSLAARLWTMDIEEPLSSNLAEEGPVGFDEKGTALQLVCDPNDRFAIWLWDVKKQALIRQFRLAEGAPAESADGFNTPTLALSPNGEFVAASTVWADDRVEAIVWNARSGERVNRLELHATSLAFSPDARYFAAAFEDDRTIKLYQVAEEPLLATIATGPAAVRCLTFGKNPKLPRSGAPPLEEWLLAAGDSGGRVTIWDLQTMQIKSIARGSRYGVASIAFSPDGSLLASAGRGHCKLSDVATGDFVLSLGQKTP